MLGYSRTLSGEQEEVDCPINTKYVKWTRRPRSILRLFTVLLVPRVARTTNTASLASVFQSFHNRAVRRNCSFFCLTSRLHPCAPLGIGLSDVRQVRGMIPRKTARGEDALTRLSVSNSPPNLRNICQNKTLELTCVFVFFALCDYYCSRHLISPRLHIPWVKACRDINQMRLRIQERPGCSLQGTAAVD